MSRDYIEPREGRSCVRLYTTHKDKKDLKAHIKKEHTLDQIKGILKASLLQDGQTAARTQAEQACSSKLHTKISLSNSIGSLLIGLR